MLIGNLTHLASLGHDQCLNFVEVINAEMRQAFGMPLRKF